MSRSTVAWILYYLIGVFLISAATGAREKRCGKGSADVGVFKSVLGIVLWPVVLVGALGLVVADAPLSPCPTVSK